MNLLEDKLFQRPKFDFGTKAQNSSY
jgi:hypothetical protein